MRKSALSLPVPSLVVLVPLLTVLTSGTARADDPKAKCPPGSWFCADVSIGAPDGDKPQALPPGGREKDEPKKLDDTKKMDAPPGSTIQVPPGGGGGTTIIINPAAPPPDAHTGSVPTPPERTRPKPRRYVPPPTYTAPRPPPPPPPRPHHREWGFNIHLAGITMGENKRNARDREPAASNAGMGGLGFSLRYRPVKAFALDFGIDFLSGHDYPGYKREETPFTIYGMFYVNPRNPVQLYFVGGLGWSGAKVERTPGTEEKWSYFGMQGGAGVEIRASQGISFNIDMLGFIRGRTDGAARLDPEFVDPTTGRSTNTSGGGLFRAGATFYW